MVHAGPFFSGFDILYFIFPVSFLADKFEQIKTAPAMALLKTLRMSAFHTNYYILFYYERPERQGLSRIEWTGKRPLI